MALGMLICVVLGTSCLNSKNTMCLVIKILKKLLTFAFSPKNGECLCEMAERLNLIGKNIN